MNILQTLSTNRMRNIVLVGCGVCLFVWLLIITYLYDSDPCKGKLYAAYLCDQYSKGVVSGSLCPKLCTNKHRITLNRCIREDRGQTVFRYEDKEIVVNSEHLQPEYMYARLRPEQLYKEPAKGSSMTDFRKMVLSYVEAKLGPGDHSNTVTNIMEIADVNKDSKVSLAEAKTIWALLHNNKFFVSVIFGTCEHLPAITEFCGDTYMSETILYRNLYDKNEDSWLSWFFPSHYKWMMPKWHKRAKIMVGLLEFTLEAFQHSSAGAFYFCDTSEANIGYNSKYEMKVMDTANVLPRHELKSRFEGHKCDSEDGCTYSPHCTMVCDTQSSQCTDEIVRPNLYLVCQLMKEYALDDAPGHVYPEFVNLLNRCDKLSYINNTRTDMEHSLVLNDLKSLLWKQIDYLEVS